MPDSFNLAGIAADLAAHALDNREHVFTKLLVPGVHEGIANSAIKAIDSYMTSIPGTDEVVLSEIAIESVLQPGGKDTFNPKAGAVKFKTRKGKVRQAKVDVQFSHTKIVQLYKSYLGQVKGGSLDPETFPFEEVVMNQIIARAQSDLRVKALFNGIYNAAGTNPEDVMDGLRSQVLAAIVASEVPAGNIIDAPAITSANGVEVFETLVDTIPSEYLYSDLICLVPRAIKTAYERNFRNEYGKFTRSESEKSFIEDTQIEFVVEPGLDGFTRPIITPRKNLVYLYDDEGAMNNVDVDYGKRTRDIAVMMDFQAGAGIGIAELIWTLDPQ